MVDNLTRCLPLLVEAALEAAVVRPPSMPWDNQAALAEAEAMMRAPRQA
jgi:hypothetical protein